MIHKPTKGQEEIEQLSIGLLSNINKVVNNDIRSKKLIKDCEKSLKITEKFVKIFRFCSMSDSVDIEDLRRLSRYLNKESQLALSLTLEINTAKRWLEVILESHTVSDYDKEIKELFKNKLTPILIKKWPKKDTLAMKKIHNFWNPNGILSPTLLEEYNNEMNALFFIQD